MRLVGETVMEGFESGTIIQIDAIVREGERDKVGVSERFTRPGPFRLDIPGIYQEVSLVVYVDQGDDGPGTGDFRYEYEKNPVVFDDAGAHSAVTIELKHPNISGSE